MTHGATAGGALEQFLGSESEWKGILQCWMASDKNTPAVQPPKASTPFNTKNPSVPRTSHAGLASAVRVRLKCTAHMAEQIPFRGNAARTFKSNNQFI